MLSSFINNIEWLTVYQAGSAAAYPGHCARCHFELSAYRDDLFSRAGIPVPADIARSVPKRRAEYLAGRYLAQKRHVTPGGWRAMYSPARPIVRRSGLRGLSVP
ncbi:hypothetical protein OS21_21220 [Dickeya oryzae]